MPKATSESVCVSHTSANEGLEDLSNSQEPPSENENEYQADSNMPYESSSDEEIVLKRSQPKPSTSQGSEAILQVYMPYIEGPKMNWNVDDGLYNRFLKWKIKCENILECELAMLSESRKCKKGHCLVR